MTNGHLKLRNDIVTASEDAEGSISSILSGKNGRKR